MPALRHDADPVVPPPQPMTRGKRAVTKGKAVPRRASHPQARKVMQVESPPLATVEEDIPVVGPSAVCGLPLFMGTPGPGEAEVFPAESGAHAGSGSFPPPF